MLTHINFNKGNALTFKKSFSKPQEAQRKAKAEKLAAAGKGPPSGGTTNKSAREGGGGGKSHGPGGQGTQGGEGHTGTTQHSGGSHPHKPQATLTHHHGRASHQETGKGSKSKAQVCTMSW